MQKPMDIQRHKNIIIGHWEPGNGTSYKAIAVRWQIGGYMQALGNVSNGWLVVNCLTGRAYLLQDKVGYLHPEYVEEKFGGRLADAEKMAELISAMLDRG